MFLAKDSFARKFTEDMIRKLHIPQLDGFVYMKKLGFADRCKFKTLCVELSNKLNLKSLFDVGEERKEDIKDFIWAEEFLIYRSVCEMDGSSYFKDMDEYSNWRESVDNDVAEFMIKEIRLFNNLYKKGASVEEMEEAEKKEEEELKKKET